MMFVHSIIENLLDFEAPHLRAWEEVEKIENGMFEGEVEQEKVHMQVGRGGEVEMEIIRAKLLTEGMQCNEA